MGKKLVTRTAKVLSETKKIKDKEAIAIAYEHIPREPGEIAHGSIYAVIEIEDKSGKAEELAEKIIDVLHDAYYDDLEKKPLEALENALAKINDELTDRSSEGHINWLGKLNAILAVFSNNTLHVTQSGKAEAYLYRGEHTMHITEDLAGDEINPQRTFINIASGDLAEKDKVVFVTPGVFYKISKHELKNYATDASPKIAAENISKLLVGDNGTAKPNALLIVEMVSPESLISDDESEKSDEVWIPTQSKKTEDVTEGAIGLIGKIGNLSSALLLFIKTKAIPKSKEVFFQIKNYIRKKTASSSEERVIIDSDESIASEKIKVSSSDIDLDDGILENPRESQKEIRIKETRRKPKLLSLERFDFSFAEKLKDSIGASRKKIKLSKGKKNIVFILIGLLLVIGFFVYLGYLQNTKSEKLAIENKFNQANHLYEESILKISQKDYAGANNDLDSAQKLITDVLGSKHFKEEAEILIKNILEKKDEAEQVTKNKASLFYEFEGNISNTHFNGTSIFGVNYQDGSTYSVNPSSGETAKITNEKINEEIIASTLVESRNVIVVYAKNNSVYEINLENGEITKQNVTGNWSKASKIASFITNIYLLSNENNQIYKHLKLFRNYGQKSDYFPTSVNLRNIIDFAIDGSVYLVDKDTNVTKYTSGQKESFSLSGIPKKYNNIKGIHTGPNIKNIYLYNDNILMIFDKNGRFLAQHKNDNIKNINAVFADDKNSNIYLLSENKIYSIKNN